MKKLFTLFMIIALTISLFAQAPQKMSYQCVIRNASGVLVTSQSIRIRISILQGTSTGSVVYTETQTPTTNANGLVSIEIGGGTGFDVINWANGPYFLKTETDPVGGTNYTIVGTSQLLSVPYALYAKSSETSSNAVTITGNQTITGIKTFSNDLVINGLTVGLGKGAVYSNSAIGPQTLYSNTTGNNNIAIGYKTLYTNTTGNNNTAHGHSVLFYNTTGSFNTANGSQALLYNTTGNSNTAIGSQALLANTTGSKNTAIGDSALRSNSTAYYNVALGYSALYSNTTGYNNTANGYQALYSNATGNGNTASGTFALKFNLGNYNTANGVAALLANTTGYLNTAIGYEAGHENMTGSYNVFLGAMAGFKETGSNKLFIDNQLRANESDARVKSLIYGVFDADPANQVLTINGNIGIGTTSPLAKMEINGGYGDRLAFYRYIDNTIVVQTLLDDKPLSTYNTYGGDVENRLILQPLVGNVGVGTFTPAYKFTVNGQTWCSSGAWTGSDIRWKKNIKNLNNSLSGILELNAVIYDLRKDEFPEMGFQTGTQIGLIAQDVEKVFPLLVNTDNNGYKAVAYDKLSAVLVEGIKEQQKQIESQQKEINELKALVKTLLDNQTVQGNK